MSITERLKARIAELEGTELFLVPLSMPGEFAIREVFASREVKTVIDPPWDDNHVGRRHQSFRATIDAFTRHDRVRISERPFNKSPNADISRVHPPEREVWDFRSLEPPGIRCFGRFAGLNRFVALTYAYREDICADDNWLEVSDWDLERDRFEAAWRTLFGDLEIFSGDTLDEYVTNHIAV
jgi:hypothetical protein